jgi:hypothetical protein
MLPPLSYPHTYTHAVAFATHRVIVQGLVYHLPGERA